MANELADLKVKIDEEPLNAGRTDQQVLDWLGETENSDNALDVTHSDYEDWLVDNKLFGEIEQAIGPSDAGSISFFMLESYKLGNGLPMSRQNIRDTIVADATPNPISGAQLVTLTALAFPSVFRWVNANWTRSPILGDVMAARAL